MRCNRVFLIIIISTMLGAGVLLAEPRVSTDKDLYEPNEKMLVHFSGAPGSNRDWIGIAPAKAKDDTVGVYDYLPSGHSKGTLTFKAPAPGTYEVRAYYNYREKGYIVSARHEFVVSSEPSPTTSILPAEPRVSTDKDNYEPNEKIQVHFSGAPGSNTDWIGIAPAKAKDDTVGVYDHLPSGHSKGTLSFKAPAPGRYEVRAYYNYREKGYVVSARHEFVVSNEPPHSTASKPPEPSSVTSSKLPEPSPATASKLPKKKTSLPQRSSPPAPPDAPGDVFGPK
jgi:hypothetical protein